MPYETITSRDNRSIKDVVRLLSSAKARKTEGLFVLEGLRLCRDAVRCGFSLKTAFFTEGLQSSHPTDIEEICAAAEKCYCISEAVAQKLSDTRSPQGVFCVIQMQKQPEFSADGKYIGLENLADPSNLGAVARTAEALGLNGIVLFGSTCDPYSPKAQRAAMGALVRLPVYNFDSLEDFAKLFPKVKTYAAVVKGGNSPSKADFSAPCMTLIGNEANGLLPKTVALCSDSLTLPMPGRAESLNAAMAATIFMWEMTK